MPDPKPKCPECDVELVTVDGKLPEKCAKCGFNIAAYGPFRRLLEAYAKEKKPGSKEKSDSFSAWLESL